MFCLATPACPRPSRLRRSMISRPDSVLRIHPTGRTAFWQSSLAGPGTNGMIDFRRSSIVIVWRLRVLFLVRQRFNPSWSRNGVVGNYSREVRFQQRTCWPLRVDYAALGSWQPDASKKRAGYAPFDAEPERYRLYIDFWVPLGVSANHRPEYRRYRAYVVPFIPCRPSS